MSRPKLVLYCDCAQAKVRAPRVRQEVLRRLSSSGVAFEAVADLCELSARRDPLLKRVAEEGELKIAACFPRAVRWLFHAAGAALPEEGVEVVNLREGGVEEMVAGLLSGRGCGTKEVERGSPPDLDDPAGGGAAGVRTAGEPMGEEDAAPEASRWYAWFPVIDYDRCNNCRQCLSFCLFGVFAVDESGQVQVERPDRCKRDCPACGRVCPEWAIIFPKYGQGPINGDEVREEDLRGDGVKVDISALLGGEGHTALRTRSRRARRRFAAEADDSQSLPEGQGHLKRKRAALERPGEVLPGLSAAGGTGQETEAAGDGPAPAQRPFRSGGDGASPKSNQE